MFLRLDTKTRHQQRLLQIIKKDFFLNRLFSGQTVVVCMKQALEQRVLYSCCLVAFIPVAWLLLSATKD